LIAVYDYFLDFRHGALNLDPDKLIKNQHQANSYSISWTWQTFE
jgi:hypothetical protein